MNLLRAKRTLVDGSGLEDILKTIYGENAVVHMMSGKAVQRSFRGHLVYQSLSQQIVTKVTLDEPQFENLVEEMKRMYVLVDKGEIVLDTLLQSNCKALNKKKELFLNSETSKLWLVYKKMVEVAQEIIDADRTGSWKMHLHAISEW